MRERIPRDASEPRVRQDEGEGAPVLAGESPADEEPELTVELLPRRKRRRHVGAERGATCCSAIARRIEENKESSE